MGGLCGRVVWEEGGNGDGEVKWIGGRQLGWRSEVERREVVGMEK